MFSYSRNFCSSSLPSQFEVNALCLCFTTSHFLSLIEAFLFLVFAVFISMRLPLFFLVESFLCQVWFCRFLMSFHEIEVSFHFS